MTAQYHPDQETLAEYALGALGAGMELLVASHLTYCPSCRRKVAELEALGGASLGYAALDDVAAPSLEATLAMIDAAPEPCEMPKPAPQGASVLPLPVQALIKGGFDEIAWSRRLPGISEHEFSGFGTESVSLIRARPGAKMLSHTHEGEEATLILSGQMRDGDHLYGKGDVALADHDHEHQPHIVGDETCVCLIVMAGKMRFTGTLGRALNVLVR